MQKSAAFGIDGDRPRDELIYVLYTEVGQQVARFAMRDGRTFLFTFAHSDLDNGDVPAQKELLRRRFGGSGWECPSILDALDRTDDLYFDRVSQIRMTSWSRGRVALVGDAAYCVSLMAGQGSALGMAGAYTLAGELHRAAGDYGAAFARYQAIFQPLIRAKLETALRFAGAFAPKSKFRLWLRNRILKSAEHRMDRRPHSRTRSDGQDFVAGLLKGIPNFPEFEKNSGTRLLEIRGLKARLFAQQLLVAGLFLGIMLHRV
jgi:2-polyprenyl-6-methoxyphenol hydroxylase-like FAD-dependent oxidoreductase